MSILQKIADIEAEMARTQKNKATAGHLGLLKGTHFTNTYVLLGLNFSNIFLLISAG